MNKKKRKKPSRRKVTFIGGPVDGSTKWMRLSDMAYYLGYVYGNREYLYKHSYKHSLKVGLPVTTDHRYVFQGHQAPFPEESNG
jgi:hypothetical protein